MNTDYIPEYKHQKIMNGAKYFYSKKPSEWNFAEHMRLMKFCKYIMEDMQQTVLKEEENGGEIQKTA